MRTMRNILGIGSVLVLSTVATTAQAQNLLNELDFVPDPKIFEDPINSEIY